MPFLFRNFVGALIDFPKPIIAVVNGPALGIACTILGLMDAVYATDRVNKIMDVLRVADKLFRFNDRAGFKRHFPLSDNLRKAAPL